MIGCLDVTISLSALLKLVLYDLIVSLQGSVFVTFANKEDCDKFLAEPETKYEDAVLIKKSKYAICFVMSLWIIKIFEST